MAKNIPLPFLPPQILHVIKCTTKTNDGKPPLIIQHGQRKVHQSAKPFQGKENEFRESKFTYQTRIGGTLSRLHAGFIEMGESYAPFNLVGKSAFLETE